LPKPEARFPNLNARHAMTAVPGTPAGFPESKSAFGLRLSANIVSTPAVEARQPKPEARF